MAIARILAVEDHPTHQYVLSQLLETFDYDVDFVATGEQAIEALAVAKYAAVLMDLKLPSMSGIDCARKIRSIEATTGRERTPIVAVTGNMDDQTRQECYKAGMDDYLAKPFEPEDLRKILLRWVYQPSKPNLKLLKRFDMSKFKQQGGSGS